MPKSKAREAQKGPPKNAFDLMMGRDRSRLRRYSCRLPYGPYVALAQLSAKLISEDVDPNMEYEEFYERYYYDVMGCAFEKEFKVFWEHGSWMYRQYFGFTWPYLRDNAGTSNGPGVNTTYAFYTVKTLKKFIAQRGLVDPFHAGLTLQYYYIRTLEKADRGYRFRLLDLPPEMRLNVYRELLLFNRMDDDGYDSEDEGDIRKACHPSILQTCREVNKEATSVLYDENPIDCSFAYFRDGDGYPVRRAQVHNEIVRGGCSHTPFVRIPDGISDYPEFLSRISHLRIAVNHFDDYGLEHTDDECSPPLNHYLFTIASFLMDNHRLKTLEIVFDLEDVEEFAYGLISWPLRRLRNIKNVKISGAPAKYKSKITRDLTSVEPAFNTLKHWKHLQDEATMQLDLLNSMFPECECGECERPCQIEDIIVDLQLIEDDKLECGFTSRHEECLMARLSHLQDGLRNLSLDRMEEQIQALKKQRAAHAEYEAITDDGRLAEAAQIWRGKMTDEEKNKDDHDWSDDEEDNTTTAMNTDDEPEKDPPDDISSSDSSALDAAQTAYIAGVVKKAQSTPEGAAHIQEYLNGIKPTPFCS